MKDEVRLVELAFAKEGAGCGSWLYLCNVSHNTLIIKLQENDCEARLETYVYIFGSL